MQMIHASLKTRAAAWRATSVLAPHLLSYSSDSFLGRVASFAQTQAGAPEMRVTRTNENAMAEGVKCMAPRGARARLAPAQPRRSQAAK